MSEPVHRAIVVVSVELFCSIVREGWSIPMGARQHIKTINGIPADAEFKYAECNWPGNEIHLTFEHSSFAATPPGTPLPIIRVTHEVQHEPIG